MKTNLGDIGNKTKRTELYRKQKGDKKAEQKDRRRRREREAQELGEVSLVLVHSSTRTSFGVYSCLVLLCIYDDMLLVCCVPASSCVSLPNRSQVKLSCIV